jgi:hypothetical protein
LPFSFKWQPHIATTFHARRSRPSGRNLSSKLNPGVLAASVQNFTVACCTQC